MPGPAQIDYDPTTAAARYVGWALPGTADATAAWAICRPVYSPANVLASVEWADGNGNYDNRWDQRASLAYVANPGLSLRSPSLELVPSGALPGTAFTLPADCDELVHRVFRNTQVLRRVASSPGLNEYTLSGTALTTGDAVQVGDWFVVQVDL